MEVLNTTFFCAKSFLIIRLSFLSILRPLGVFFFYKYFFKHLRSNLFESTVSKAKEQMDGKCLIIMLDA